MTQDTSKRFFRIYGKAPSQASYKAMNLGEGVQTSNLIYATMLSQAEAQPRVVLANPGGQVDET